MKDWVRKIRLTSLIVWKGCISYRSSSGKKEFSMTIFSLVSILKCKSWRICSQIMRNWKIYSLDCFKEARKIDNSFGYLSPLKLIDFLLKNEREFLKSNSNLLILHRTTLEWQKQSLTKLSSSKQSSRFLIMKLMLPLNSFLRLKTLTIWLVFSCVFKSQAKMHFLKEIFMSIEFISKWVNLSKTSTWVSSTKTGCSLQVCCYTGLWTVYCKCLTI